MSSGTKYDAPRLRELREFLEIPQAEFARRCGLSIRGLRLIESGEHQPKLETARKIAKALGTRVEVIFPERGGEQ
jgi:DNA-binding XRE family transcriptional regulator